MEPNDALHHPQTACLGPCSWPGRLPGRDTGPLLKSPSEKRRNGWLLRSMQAQQRTVWHLPITSCVSQSLKESCVSHPNPDFQDPGLWTRCPLESPLTQSIWEGILLQSSCFLLPKVPLLPSGWAPANHLPNMQKRREDKFSCRKTQTEKEPVLPALTKSNFGAGGPSALPGSLSSPASPRPSVPSGLGSAPAGLRGRRHCRGSARSRPQARAAQALRALCRTPGSPRTGAEDLPPPQGRPRHLPTRRTPRGLAVRVRPGSPRGKLQAAHTLSPPRVTVPKPARPAGTRSDYHRGRTSSCDRWLARGWRGAAGGPAGPVATAALCPLARRPARRQLQRQQCRGGHPAGGMKHFDYSAEMMIHRDTHASGKHCHSIVKILFCSLNNGFYLRLGKLIDIEGQIVPISCSASTLVKLDGQVPCILCPLNCLDPASVPL
ncbi:uncharacterized protein ACIGJ3_013609 [Trichechus inunguis]